MKLHFEGIPLSLNKAWYCKGVQRFKTPAYKKFIEDIEAQLWLQKKSIIHFSPKTPLYIRYEWYLTNDINTDYDNPIKPLQDCLVEYDVIDDDRYIRRCVVTKYKSKTNHFNVEILEIDMRTEAEVGCDGFYGQHLWMPK